MSQLPWCFVKGRLKGEGKRTTTRMRRKRKAKKMRKTRKKFLPKRGEGNNQPQVT